MTRHPSPGTHLNITKNKGNKGGCPKPGKYEILGLFNRAR
jgi:hypothetical protein